MSLVKGERYNSFEVLSNWIYNTGFYERFSVIISRIISSERKSMLSSTLNLCKCLADLRNI